MNKTSIIFIPFVGSVSIIKGDDYRKVKVFDVQSLPEVRNLLIEIWDTELGRLPDCHFKYSVNFPYGYRGYIAKDVPDSLIEMVFSSDDEIVSLAIKLMVDKNLFVEAKKFEDEVFN